MTTLETRAKTEFGLPQKASKKLRAGYLAYLGEALATTCTPTIWPPESWPEWVESQQQKGKR